MHWFGAIPTTERLTKLSQVVGKVGVGDEQKTHLGAEYIMQLRLFTMPNNSVRLMLHNTLPSH
jgi:hypothetical protein